jgi:hypothetical protein
VESGDIVVGWLVEGGDVVVDEATSLISFFFCSAAIDAWVADRIFEVTESIVVVPFK